MKKKEEYVTVEDFLEEMVSVINSRLEKQDHAISTIESHIDSVKKSVDRLSKERNLKIDKSVLRVIKQ